MKSDRAQTTGEKLSRKKYEKHLKKLQVELVRLQDPPRER